ncbi:MAG: AraC family transcriptional regulator [Lachnospiraceae bacterium]|nr:AraC family transcriptional regulator [Lachnospiraceae bacterium]
METDLSEILLEQIKNSMDVKSYWRLCDELRFVCGDMRAIYGLDEYETLTFEDCQYIEDAFEKLRRQIMELMHCMNPEIRETPVICQAIHYIRKNYAGPVNQKELAANLGVSSAYLSHLFAQKVGVTFSDYLLAVRLRQAKRLLAQGKKKINEVAQETGFENAKYFCKVFKGRTEMTPREYQKKYHGERRG